jgi:hypothetical protein
MVAAKKIPCWWCGDTLTRNPSRVATNKGDTQMGHVCPDLDEVVPVHGRCNAEMGNACYKKGCSVHCGHVSKWLRPVGPPVRILRGVGVCHAKR